jgi:alpha-D-ribose 1-methylphosphonate 5-triphosphate synthase subunit PhnL
MPVMLEASGLSKGFTMHLRGGSRLEVLRNASFSLAAGECAVLGGPSGAGKSSILKMLYGNYAVDEGRIEVMHRGSPVDLVDGVPSRRAAAAPLHALPLRGNLAASSR